MHGEETSIFNAILITCGIFMLILFVLFYAVVKQHRRNITLYKSKLSAEIAAMEKERGRIAADLHDDLGPLLSAIKFKITPSGILENDRKSLDDAQLYIDDVLRKLRQISNDLMPLTLSRKGICTALEEFINLHNGRHAMQINFNCNLLPALSDSTAINLYRVSLEIMHNSVKHAEASHMEVTLEAAGKHLHLSISDNGKGFDTAQMRSGQSGRGLRNIENRVEFLGGDIYLDSSSKIGTRYLIKIPVTPQSTNHETDLSQNEDHYSR